MLLAEEVTAPADASSIYSLTTVDVDTVNEIILQAPAGNAANIYFGSPSAQPGFIIPGGSAVLWGASLKQTFVKGTGPDTIIFLAPALDRM